MSDVDEARLEMVSQLHVAVHGDVWARPHPPSVIWAELLAAVEELKRQRNFWMNEASKLYATQQHATMDAAVNQAKRR